MAEYKQRAWASKIRRRTKNRLAPKPSRNMRIPVESPERIRLVGYEILTFVNDGTARHIALAALVFAPRRDPVKLPYGLVFQSKWNH